MKIHQIILGRINAIYHAILGRIKAIYRELPKRFSDLVAWIVISYGILPILILGLIFVLISQSSSAGAVLVGCSIVSQALLQIWPLAAFIGGRKTQAQIEIELLNPSTRGIIQVRGFGVTNAFNHLKRIAIQNELEFLRPQENNKIEWAYELTICRVYLSLEWCIVICAVIGTLVWAYAPSK